MEESGDQERVIYWPNNEPFIHAIIENITPSMRTRGWFCLHLIAYNRTDQHFEPIKFHVPGYLARQYTIGDFYAAHFRRLGPL